LSAVLRLERRSTARAEASTGFAAAGCADDFRISWLCHALQPTWRREHWQVIIEAMRIALSNSSSKWGGVHKATEILARGFQDRGHEVIVLGYPDGMLQDRMKDVAPFEPIMKGMDLHPLTMVKIKRALDRHRTDIVLAMMKKDVRLSVPAARLSGIPTVVRHANDRALDGGLYDRLFFGTIPDRHIVNSLATRDTLLGSAPWIRERDVTVIYNGIDPAPLIDAAPADLGIPPGSITFGFVGRLEIRKGLIDLAKAWSTVAPSVPNGWLVITGSGADEEEARRAVGDAPRVRWLGYRKDVAQILKSLHVLVVPSHWEGFGFVAAEGMVAGVPVVAANASSLAEIIEDGVSGRLVPPRNAAELARAMTELARNPEERARLAGAGRERVLRAFNVNQMVDGYAQVLQDTISARATRKM
jgi:glycosyltransferase involved in cell wall biosynthesis